jgi:hypothetical protein
MRASDTVANDRYKFVYRGAFDSAASISASLVKPVEAENTAMANAITPGGEMLLPRSATTPAATLMMI